MANGNGLMPFTRTYTDADFGFGDIDSDVTLTASEWVIIGKLKCGAQQELAWGSGGTGGGVDTRKRITLQLEHTDSAQIHGVVRFAYTNATMTNKQVVLEDRTENLDDGVELGEFLKMRAKEDSYLVIEVKIDGSVDKILDVSDVDTKLLAPATLYQ